MSETKKCSKPGCGDQRILGEPCRDFDCPQQSVDASAYAALRKRFDCQVDYAIDLQRIIEDICNSREIRPPESGARFHYDMAVAYRAKVSPSLPTPAATPTDSANPPPVESVGPNSEAQP